MQRSVAFNVSFSNTVELCKKTFGALACVGKMDRSTVFLSGFSLPTITPLSRAPRISLADRPSLPLALSSYTDPDPIHALRDATRQLHAQLDRGLPLAQARATLADYARHLVVLRDWQQALAPWLSRTGRDVSSLELIARDLADCPPCIGGIGGSADAMEPVDLTPVHRADDGSLAFCWGMAYVLEGSRLGGQVLSRRLQARLAPHPLRYLGERGADGASWGDTLKALREALATADARRAGCAGAVAAFQTRLLRFEELGCFV